MKYKLSKRAWESIGKQAGWVKEAQYESAINGKSKQSARNFIYRIIGDLTKGFFRDEDWSNVNAIWKRLDEYNIENNLVGTEYFKDERGELAGKMFKFEVPFINNKGREDVLHGTLTAHFSGTVQDPTSVYDISFVI